MSLTPSRVGSGGIAKPSAWSKKRRRGRMNDRHDTNRAHARTRTRTHTRARMDTRTHAHRPQRGSPQRETQGAVWGDHGAHSGSDRGSRSASVKTRKADAGRWVAARTGKVMVSGARARPRPQSLGLTHLPLHKAQAHCVLRPPTCDRRKSARLPPGGCRREGGNQRPQLKKSAADLQLQTALSQRQARIRHARTHATRTRRSGTDGRRTADERGGWEMEQRKGRKRMSFG